MKFLHYIVEAGGQVRIPAIAQPKHDLASAEEAAGLALAWENEVTAQINALMDLAIEQKDHIAQDFLRWFVTEQLEEVSTMSTLLSVIRRGRGQTCCGSSVLARQPLGEPEGGEPERAPEREIKHDTPRFNVRDRHVDASKGFSSKGGCPVCSLVALRDTHVPASAAGIRI